MNETINKIKEVLNKYEETSIGEYNSADAMGDIERIVKADDGMTLRDYFAAKAMQSVLLNEKLLSVLSKDAAALPDLVAAVSFDMADKMLAARKAVR